MSQSKDSVNPFDPTGMFKGLRDSGMDAWSKMMVQFVNTEAYAQATGTMLDAWLATSEPFRKAVEKATTQVLINLNMPTRTDVIGLAERLTHIEMRLDDLEARLAEARPGAGQARGANRPPPPAEGQP
jgi:hypothetical protein